MYLRTAIFQSHQCRMYSICIYIHVYIYILYSHTPRILRYYNYSETTRSFLPQGLYIQKENRDRPGHSNLIADERESNRSKGRWSRSEGANGAASEKSTGNHWASSFGIVGLMEGRVEWIDSFVDIKAMIHTFWKVDIYQQ